MTRPPRKFFGNRKRTAANRRNSALAYVLACKRNGISPDLDVLERCHGVKAAEADQLIRSQA